jgi:hypothetical protein
MGFLGSIGKAIGGIAKTVGDVASKVGEFAGKVADVAGKAVKILQAPEEALGGFIKKAAGGLLDKLPFNLGNMIKPFANKVIDGGLALLSKSNLGSVFEFAKKLAPKVDQLANFAEAIQGAAKKVDAFADGVAGESSLGNVQELFSAAQADGLAERYAA